MKTQNRAATMKTQNRAAKYRICSPGNATDPRFYYIQRSKKPKSSQMFSKNHSKLKHNRNLKQPFSTTGFNIVLP